MLPLRPRNAKETWKAPSGHRDDVGSLSVAHEKHNGMFFLVSKWEPTPDELQRLLSGAPVVLGISMPKHPVVFLSVGLPPA